MHFPGAAKVFGGEAEFLLSDGVVDLVHGLHEHGVTGIAVVEQVELDVCLGGEIHEDDAGFFVGVSFDEDFIECHGGKLGYFDA